MPYQQEISRENPGYFLFLLDQSFSMEEPLGGSTEPKMNLLALAINSWLHNMTIRATGSEGVKDWVDISVVGYRTDLNAVPIIEPPLKGALAGKWVIPLSEIAAHPSDMLERKRQICDEDTGELMEVTEKTPVWVKPVAEGGTPMCTALHKVHELVSQWIEKHPRSFPPIVIHITDGESQEGDPKEYAAAITEDLETADGKVLLFNCHLSSMKHDECLFPSSDELLQDELGRDLFKMSSLLPDTLYQRAKSEGFDISERARGMAYNADMVVLIKFLDMGTRPARLR